MKNNLLLLVLSLNALLAGVGRAAAPAPALPAASYEQRLSALEAYIANADPAATMKDTNGNLTVTAPATLGVAGPGHNAWMMTSSALVLFMTLPGLALFYGGLVRRKNVLSMLAQCYGIAGLVTILWVLFGYSMIFADGTDMIQGVVGNLKHAMLKGVGAAPNLNYSYWVSHSVFSMFQLMFAIITPALIIGAVAERMKFGAVLLFVGVWMVIVYFPLAHMMWGVNGMMNGVWNPNATVKSIDFAGGTVVHMSSGWSALVLCLILGKRLGFPRDNFAPHSMVLCGIGAGMLWVGWYGFNAGSAVGADGIAANAFMTTTIATATASFVWPVVEWIARGRPSLLGFCSGVVSGLVMITPACGFVTAGGALVIGIVAGTVPWFFCYYVKGWFGYDDALDTFGVHAISGTIGALLTGVLARNEANPNLATYLKGYVTDSCFQPLVWEQVKAVTVTLLLVTVGSAVIAFHVKSILGSLRSSESDEQVGLDIADHGEEGYHT